jgi:soluble lytic murein transglycosylase-like protein
VRRLFAGGVRSLYEKAISRMRKLLGLFLLLGLLYGCSDAGYLPYAPHALDPAQIQSLVSDASSRNAVSPALVKAVVMAESAGNPSASTAGAQGLMQLMPGTAASCGINNPFDPAQNVDCGTRYLHGLLERYNNNVELAVAAYNAGPGAVDEYHGVPPYAETRAYVDRVLTAYRDY